MNQREVTYLIHILQDGSSDNEVYSRDAIHNILNNLEYYTPRLRDLKLLRVLVDALFNSQLFCLVGNNSVDHLTLLDLHALGRSIFQWKLEISEPTVPLDSFYRVWDDCFARSSPDNWTLPKIFILSGVLATEDTFKRLQETSFIDGSGKVMNLYTEWMDRYFLPVWSHAFLSGYRSSATVDSLALVFSVLFKGIESRRGTNLPGINWSMLSVSLVRVLGSIFKLKSSKQPHLEMQIPAGMKSYYFYSYYSTIPFTLSISLKNTDAGTLSSLLSNITEICKYWSFDELDLKRKIVPEEQRSTVYITLIVTLKALLQARQDVPQEWYYRTLIALFHLSFMSQDFGTVGFLDYEFVYHCAVRGVSSDPVDTLDKLPIYAELIEYMEFEIPGGNHFDDYGNHSDKTSKILFLLDFIENVNSLVSDMPASIATSVIYPIIHKYLLLPLRSSSSSSRPPERERTNRDILEAAHAAMLSFYLNPYSGSETPDVKFTLWKLARITEYLNVSIDQFLDNRISDRQIKLIASSLASFLFSTEAVNTKVPKYQVYEPTMLRLLRIPVTKETEDQRKVLTECLMDQLPFVSNDAERCQRLDEIMNIVKNSEFDERSYQEILDTLWEVILASRSDEGIRWWYTHMTRYRGKL